MTTGKEDQRVWYLPAQKEIYQDKTEEVEEKWIARYIAKRRKEEEEDYTKRIIIMTLCVTDDQTVV